MSDSITYIVPQSLRHDGCVIRFSVPQAGKAVVTVEGGSDSFKINLLETNDIGRVVIDNLKPMSRYDITVRIDDLTEKLSVETLPAPFGDPLFSFAVIGDPHLSFKPENRGGRMHCESRMLLREIVAGINDGRHAFTLLAGDLADTGDVREFEAAASILNELDGEVFAVPGNHDFVGGAKCRKLWKEYFGATAGTEKRFGWNILSLDTANEMLNKPANIDAITALDENAPVLALTHYQLFPDDHITCADRHISDIDESLDLLDKISSMRGVLYVGHKNIASRVDAGEVIQLNVPQVTHFPAGHLVVTAYQNGLYHKFEPIPSEVLNEYSRRCWTRNGIDMSYRDGRSLETWNFLAPFAASGELS